ncbi:MAG: hypothetical protein ACLUN5_02795 [Oscillospiraceae bacterium]
MKKRTLGLAMCGSFCTFSRVLDAFETLDQELYELVPIMSQASFETDSRFGLRRSSGSGWKRCADARSSIQ